MTRYADSEIADLVRMCTGDGVVKYDIVAKLLAEIQEWRRTAAATEDEVREAVERIVREEFTDKYDNDEIINADWVGIRQDIAARVAAQLAGRVGLSDGDVFALKLAASDRQLRADRPALCEALDRLLGGKP